MSNQHTTSPYLGFLYASDDSTNDGPEIDIIRIERMNILLDSGEVTLSTYDVPYNSNGQDL